MQTQCLAIACKYIKLAIVIEVPKSCEVGVIISNRANCTSRQYVDCRSHWIGELCHEGLSRLIDEITSNQDIDDLGHFICFKSHVPFQ